MKWFAIVVVIKFVCIVLQDKKQELWLGILTIQQHLINESSVETLREGITRYIHPMSPLFPKVIIRLSTALILETIEAVFLIMASLLRSKMFDHRDHCSFAPAGVFMSVVALASLFLIHQTSAFLLVRNWPASNFGPTFKLVLHEDGSAPSAVQPKVQGIDNSEQN